MIDLRTGDLFSTDAPAIGHGCNCMGLMGAGIANAIRARYPRGYEAYRQACVEGRFAPGGAMVCRPEPGAPYRLVNLATQDRPGPHARLRWVESSLRVAIPKLRGLGIDRLALPRIGCGIGGLRFGDVLEVLASVSCNTGLRIEVWTLESDLSATVKAV